jgi:hypothetical protein
MPRYDQGDYGYDRGDFRGPQGVSMRGIAQSPRYHQGPTRDPNYQGGEYGGLRMQPGARGQAAYGWYRASHARDLGDAGGYEGRYGRQWEHGRGRFDRQGLYREEFDRERNGAWRENRDMGMRGAPTDRPRGPQQGWPRYDDEHRGPWNGGVRQDVGHVRQLNANSVAFRRGGGGQRGFGWAEHPAQGGGDGRGRGSENQYGGRNAGGFSEMHRPRQASR